jgi:RYK receptor-like tyrosine kinase
VDANGSECLQNVLIKTVTDEARHDQIEVMLKDACLTKGVSHDHIASVIMTCLMPLDHPPLVIYADIGSGTCNLKKFLQHCKMSEVLSAQQLVYLAIQIARGIQHLHRKRLLHRDVATRNCLVNAQLHVQVTDSALARDIFPNDYHCLGDNENRPIKWLALEALVHRKFSTASDMWAFGVTIWELFTLGQQPYCEIDPFEMALYLQDGYRITQPLNCPSDLFAIMACCWCLNPDERPKFVQMQACLQDFYAALGRFV